MAKIIAFDEEARRGLERGLNTLADAVNPNTSQQYSDYNWNDLNGDLIYQECEETTLITRFGGVANASIDPDLNNSYTDETSVFVERAVLENLGVRVGFVYKKDNDGWQQVNTARPFDAFNVPVTVPDPGPDNIVGTADDGEGDAAAQEDALDLGHELAALEGAQEDGDVVGLEWRFELLEFPVRGCCCAGRASHRHSRCRRMLRPCASRPPDRGSAPRSRHPGSGRDGRRANAPSTGGTG